jgi:hypothetical protein
MSVLETSLAPDGHWAEQIDKAVCTSNSAKASATRAEGTAADALELCQSLAEGQSSVREPDDELLDEVRSAWLRAMKL